MKVYLDNAATTKPYDEVITLMNEIQKEYYGNPSSAHTMGLEAEKAIKKSGDIIGKSLNTRRENIVFTSGGTEADNMAVMQPFFNVDKIADKQIVISSVEHPAVNGPCDYLGNMNAQIVRIPVDGNGLIDLNKLELSINDNTAIISVMYANNEVGTIQPVEDICAIKERMVFSGNRDILLHTDAVQAYGKLPIDVSTGHYTNIDLMTLSSHKIHGPKGTGALYAKTPKKLKPLLRGGGQERGYRSGTEDVAGIAGFGCAAGIQDENRISNMKKITKLRKILLDGLVSNIKKTRINSPIEVSLSGEPGKCIPNILSVSFSGTKGEVILHSLEQNGIFVSTESACSSKKKGTSPLLTAMGMNPDEIEGTIRFSLSSFNTEQEIEYTVTETKKAVEKFRKLTGYK